MPFHIKLDEVVPAMPVAFGGVRARLSVLASKLRRRRAAVVAAAVVAVCGVTAPLALASVPDGTGITHAHDVACHDAGLSINFCGLYFTGDTAIGSSERRYTWESYNPGGCSYNIYVTVNSAGTIVGNSTSFCF